MFRKHFGRRLERRWSEQSEEQSSPPWAEHGRWGRHFGRWMRHLHQWGEDAPFEFAPDHRFDRPFRRGGPFGRDPFDEGGGRRRQRRGDIKYVLLELLAEQPRHGYELIKELEQRYGGFYRPSPGSVYPTLQLLEDEGHLSSEQVEGKRIYTITDSGRQLLEEQRERQRDDREDPRAQGFGGRHAVTGLHELRKSGMALVDSVMQAARHGTPEQIQAVLKLLETTRREIYAILAQDAAEQPGNDQG